MPKKYDSCLSLCGLAQVTSADRCGDRDLRLWPPNLYTEVGAHRIRQTLSRGEIIIRGIGSPSIPQKREHQSEGTAYMGIGANRTSIEAPGCSALSSDTLFYLPML